MSRDEPFFDVVEAVTSPPSGGKAQMWAWGVGLAAFPFAYGAFCCWTQHAKTINVTFRGVRPVAEGFLLDVQGSPAIALGVLWMFVGSLMHFQWFWGNHPKLANYHEIGKYASVLGIIAAIACHVYFVMLR
jgi:hypothetical protein